MAITQPVLDGNSLAYPTSYTEKARYWRAVMEMADGTQRAVTVNANIKRVFEITWEAITGAQKSTIETAYAAVKTDSVSFTDPDGTVFTVTIDGDFDLDWTWRRAAGSTYVYDGTLRLREV